MFVRGWKLEVSDQVTQMVDTPCCSMPCRNAIAEHMRIPYLHFEGPTGSYSFMISETAASRQSFNRYFDEAFK